MTQTTTASGLVYEDLEVGTGPEAAAGMHVQVHYTGWLYHDGQKGTQFDSSKDRGQAFGFQLGAGMVIKGWDEGFATMKKGEKAILRCRSDYAYGPSGQGSIPPNATLNFDVELIDFKSKGTQRKCARSRLRDGWRGCFRFSQYSWS